MDGGQRLNWMHLEVNFLLHLQEKHVNTHKSYFLSLDPNPHTKITNCISNDFSATTSIDFKFFFLLDFLCLNLHHDRRTFTSCFLSWALWNFRFSLFSFSSFLNSLFSFIFTHCTKINHFSFNGKTEALPFFLSLFNKSYSRQLNLRAKCFFGFVSTQTLCLWNPMMTLWVSNKFLARTKDKNTSLHLVTVQ